LSEAALSIVVAGMLAVWLGYRLFDRAVSRWTAPETSSSITVDPRGVTLRNVAPGTVFCVFGIVLIATMVIQGMPELRTSATTAAGAQAMQVRGSGATLVAQGLAAQGIHDDETAIARYEAALDSLAVPANNLAGLYLKRGETRRAVPLARFATHLQPLNAAYWDTLADALRSTREPTEALEAIRQAAALDNRFSSKAADFERNHTAATQR
jgi:tetratricopeptide (TPR) repeat protein